MAWFSPIKGGYPSLAQIDRTLPLDPNFVNCDRGMILKVVDSNGVQAWTYADSAVPANGPLYVALQNKDDTQAGMAGLPAAGMGQPADTDYSRNPDAGIPLGGGTYAPSFTGTIRVSGLALAQEGEYQTDVFSGADLKVGDPPTVSDGKLVKGDVTNYEQVVGFVTKAPFSRWVNDAKATRNGTLIDPPTRTGAQVTVIQFTTAKH